MDGRFVANNPHGLPYCSERELDSTLIPPWSQTHGPSRRANSYHCSTRELDSVLARPPLPSKDLLLAYVRCRSFPHASVLSCLCNKCGSKECTPPPPPSGNRDGVVILQSWAGFEAYTIARLPQLERLDGKEITRTDRIKAQQRLPALRKEIPLLAQKVTSSVAAMCRSM